IDALRPVAGRLTLMAADAGMHMVGRLDPAEDDRAIAEAARDLGVQAPALSTYFQGQPGASGLVLGYAGVDETGITLAAKRLIEAIETA
ncbi:MAG: PLP-dependent aminotransferase family protein, partial [Pseudomonadota bacterium]